MRYVSNWFLPIIFILITCAAYSVNRIMTRDINVYVDLTGKRKACPNIVRVIAEPLVFEIKYPFSSDEAKKEGGRTKGQRFLKELSQTYVVDPGYPIKIAVSDEKSEVIYESLPSVPFATIGWRPMTPFVEDGDIHTLHWQVGNNMGYILHPGIQKICFSVVDAGEFTRKENGYISIFPQMGSPVLRKDTKIVWWIKAWPYYACFTVIYLTAIFLINRRYNKSRHSAN